MTDSNSLKKGVGGGEAVGSESVLWLWLLERIHVQLCMYS